MAGTGKNLSLLATKAAEQPVAALEAAEQVGFVIDVERGRITGGNAQAAKLWGVAGEAALARLPLDRAMPAFARLAQLLLTPSPVEEKQTLVFWTPQGVERLECRVTAIDGAPAEARIEVVGMAAVGEGVRMPPFAARISHELRTPLTSILGFAELMRQERFGPLGHAKYLEYCRDIETSAQHALSLVNDLLELSRANAGALSMRPVEIDGNGIAAECLAAMQPIADSKGVILIGELGAGPATFVIDKRALSQILLNLLANAIKFTPARGEVRLSSIGDGAGTLSFLVADTGRGMSEPEMLRALHPFEQMGEDAGEGGIGLGLPIAKALAEANGGELTIVSASGRGTQVNVAFGGAKLRPKAIS